MTCKGLAIFSRDGEREWPPWSLCGEDTYSTSLPHRTLLTPQSCPQTQSHWRLGLNIRTGEVAVLFCLEQEGTCSIVSRPRSRGAKGLQESWLEEAIVPDLPSAVVNGWHLTRIYQRNLTRGGFPSSPATRSHGFLGTQRRSSSQSCCSSPALFCSKCP